MKKSILAVAIVAGFTTSVQAASVKYTAASTQVWRVFLVQAQMMKPIRPSVRTTFIVKMGYQRKRGFRWRLWCLFRAGIRST